MNFDAAASAPARAAKGASVASGEIAATGRTAARVVRTFEPKE